MTYDLVALGETMLALAPPAGVSLESAATLLVDHAGAESNACVGLARLGLRVAWVSRLGVDAAGERILAALRGEGVDVSWVERDPQRLTGVMLKDPPAGVRYYRRESAASVMTAALLDPVPVADAHAVLVSGVTALLGPQPHGAGLALLERARGLRIVDPNLRIGLWGSERRSALVRPFVERCDLLLSGGDELAEVLGADNGLKAEALARAASALGPREIVVRGLAAIGVLADGAWHSLEIRRGASVDPIGAGDAFNAGYISIRLRGGLVDAALHAGVRCGAAVTTAISDTAAFPKEVR